MKRLILSFGLFFFAPAFICQAEMSGLDESPKRHTLPASLAKDAAVLPPKDSTQVMYRFMIVSIQETPASPFQITRSQIPSKNPFALVGTAEASPSLNVISFDHFERIVNSVNQANKLYDLRPVMSDRNFQALKARHAEGASENVILALISSMRPRDIHVMDTSLEHDRLTLSVTGQSSFGRTYGLIYLVKEDGLWKIDREQWQTGREAAVEIKPEPVLTPLTVTDLKTNHRGILNELGPDYRFNRNFLSLTKVVYPKESRAFTFVFYMNPEKEHLKRLNRVEDMPSEIKERQRMHIMWTASKKMFREQKIIEKEYPMDVSIANYNDGFASGEWNLILPRKKPRGAIVSWLWSF